MRGRGVVFFCAEEESEEVLEFMSGILTPIRIGSFADMTNDANCAIM
jgi:hypothetical protein